MPLSLIRIGCGALSQHAGCILSACGVINLGCRAISTDQRVSSSQLIAKWQGLLRPQQQHNSGLQDQHSASDDHLPTEQLRQLCQDAIHGEFNLSAGGSACMRIQVLCAARMPYQEASVC